MAIHLMASPARHGTRPCTQTRRSAPSGGPTPGSPVSHHLLHPNIRWSCPRMGTSSFRQSDLPFPLLRGPAIHPLPPAPPIFGAAPPFREDPIKTPSRSHLLSLIPLPIPFTLHRLTHTPTHTTHTHTYKQILILILVTGRACGYTAYRVHLPISPPATLNPPSGKRRCIHLHGRPKRESSPPIAASRVPSTTHPSTLYPPSRREQYYTCPVLHWLPTAGTGHRKPKKSPTQFKTHWTCWLGIERQPSARVLLIRR